MSPLIAILSCLLSWAPEPEATPAAPATQPAAGRPVYYVSKYSTTYHLADCNMLPKDDRQVAKPEELRTKPPCKFCVREPAEDGGVPTTQPALTGLARYHNLVKNEFINEEDGAVELIFPDLQQAIARMRATAAEEKKLIDLDIAELTREIQAAEASRKAAKKQEREEKADARRHAARQDRTDYHYGLGRVYTYRHHSYFEEYETDAAKRRAREQRQNADRAKGDVNSMRVELMQLKKESAALAAVASPSSRSLPPRQFWRDLPQDQQEQLERVGITQEQLKALLARMGQTEESFITLAKTLEKDARSTDQLVKLLREYFENQLGPRRPPPKATTARPAMGQPVPPPLGPKS